MTVPPSASNLAFVEGLYADYARDPGSVPPEWRDYFRHFPNGDFSTARALPRLKPSFRAPTLFNPAPRNGGDTTTALEPARLTELQDRINQLIRIYRIRGHIIARVDPLRQPRRSPPELDPAHIGLTEADMDREVTSHTMPLPGPLTVRQLITRLRNTYCQSIGVQFMHIDDLAMRRWLRERMEATENKLRLDRAEQLRILTRLTDAVTFEEFIRRKFVGAKSFSLEGSESLIPLLDLAIEKAGEQGIQEVVLGMAHRGRLNVLANIIGKSPKQIFREFTDADPHLYVGRGDVKYHLGYSADWQCASGQKIHLSLCFNPSHLEFVNAVALGRTRAKQDRAGDVERSRRMTLLIHGDAAFAGEGIIQETLNLHRLPGYSVGGTLHVIVNNQIGFTTSPEEGRSSPYATDVAKMVQGPIFHVNGEDPEAVAQVVRLAMDFRATFKRDVFIDMYAYRRLGHNEGDEPSFTQPQLYQTIADRKSVREGYLDHLLKRNEVTREEADRIAQERRELLERELSAATSPDYKAPSEIPGVWKGFPGGPEDSVPEPDTCVPADKLSAILRKLTELPDGFHPHPKLKRFLEARREMASGTHPVDWAAAEALAFGTAVLEGHRLRLSGQDSARGTFSQRHAVLHDYANGRIWTPLANLDSAQAPAEIINSPLSEAGVLGFDYGYSLDCPNGLILWEAQYGDFVNAAQVIVDQFIASAEDKWSRLSGLVLLLPHGFEGSGPEHSSARLERFLALAAEHNIQIVQPTTAAQYFHVLRRQTIRPWRKPLVIMTPKSLLRDPHVASPMAEFATGRFQRIIGDPTPPEAVRRILLCSGKIYYDLLKERERLQPGDVAILRFEQLYPLPDEAVAAVLAPYRDSARVVWVQEEPENMGAWRWIRDRFGDKLFERLPLSKITRPASASPATGSPNSHKREQAELVAAAFARDSGA